MEQTYISPKPKADKTLKSVFDFIEPIVFALVAVLFISLFVGRLTVVDGESMENTLHNGEYLLVVDPLLSYEPKQGDIVVVKGDFEGSLYDKPIVKRVIATGGDKVKIDFSSGVPIVHVNGVQYQTKFEKNDFDAEYSIFNNSLEICSLADYEYYYLGYGHNGEKLSNYNKNYDYNTKVLTVEVPYGEVFVMGDNRYHSADSRISEIGCVKEKYILGKAIFRLLPFKKIGGLYNK